MESDDIKALQHQYLHGDCFDFAHELSMQFQRQDMPVRLVLVRTAASRIPVHAAIAVSDNVALDASGLISIGFLLKYWQPIIQKNMDERAAIEVMPIENIYNFFSPLDDDEDEYGAFSIVVREDVRAILQFTGVDIHCIKPIKQIGA